MRLMSCASALQLLAMLLTSGLHSASQLQPSSHFFSMNNNGEYHFGYDTGYEERSQSFRLERRDRFGRVTGRFGYVDPDGALRITEYVADRKGYRAIADVFHPVYMLAPPSPLVVGPIPQVTKPLSEEAPFVPRTKPASEASAGHFSTLPSPLLLIGPLPPAFQPANRAGIGGGVDSDFSFSHNLLQDAEDILRTDFGGAYDDDPLSLQDNDLTYPDPLQYLDFPEDPFDPALLKPAFAPLPQKTEFPQVFESPHSQGIQSPYQSSPAGEDRISSLSDLNENEYEGTDSGNGSPSEQNNEKEEFLNVTQSDGITTLNISLSVFVIEKHQKKTSVFAEDAGSSFNSKDNKTLSSPNLSSNTSLYLELALVPPEPSGGILLQTEKHGAEGNAAAKHTNSTHSTQRTPKKGSDTSKVPFLQFKLYSPPLQEYILPDFKMDLPKREGFEHENAVNQSAEQSGQRTRSNASEIDVRR